MEAESNKKRQKLRDIEPNKLIDRQDDEPPLLVVTNADASGDDLKLLSDSYLQDLIKKCRKTYVTLASRLPDGGRKLKERLTSLEQEKESRDRNRLIANPRIRGFRGNDLTLMMNCYGTLFGETVATGDRARTANMYSAVNLKIGEEFTEARADDGKEGSGDSDENYMQGQTSLFPATSLKGGQDSGSKRKRPGAEYICNHIDGIVAAMLSRSTQSTAAQTKAANDEAALYAVFDILNNMELVPPGSDLYCFAGQSFLHNKINRTFFLKAPNNQIRFQQLMYAFKAAGNNLGAP